MPDPIYPPYQVADAIRRSTPANYLPGDRSPAFGCATLRNSLKSTPGRLMARQESPTGAGNEAPANAPGFAPSGAFFLRTKLLPPRPTPEILARPRLIERLQANLALPVTLVTANAGSGKTTLIADFLRKQERPYVWYQLDHTDADASVFLGYLAYGIQQRVADFGETLFAYLQQSQQFAEQPERAADVLLNEILELVEQPLIIVLDDYHHLGTETHVHAVLDR